MIEILSLGFLTLHPQSQSDYATNVAMQSYKYGITVYRFHPTNWDPLTNFVKGERFHHNLKRWLTSTFPLPNFIYDRCYYTQPLQTNTYKVVKQLKKQTDFLSIGLPNKWTVYNMIKNYPTLEKHLPQTILVRNAEQIMKQLMHKKQLVLKPIHGAHGKGIFFLSKRLNNTIVVQTHQHGHKRHTSFSQQQFKQWWQTLKRNHHYIIQPFLPLLNDKKEPYDIRILMQKNGFGHWQETGRGIRYGKKGNYVSNLHNGGRITTFDDGLSHVTKEKKQHIEKQLKRCISIIPSHLEQQHGPLFEIAIDFGIDQSGNCWILEVNSKPGYQTILQTTTNELYDNPLRYCLYLHELKSKGVVHQ